MSRPIELPTALIHEAGSTGVLCWQQIRRHLSDRQLLRALKFGLLQHVWQDAYLLIGPRYEAVPDWPADASEEQRERVRRRIVAIRHLEAADLVLGSPAVACSHTAAALHGFDVEGDGKIHVLSPGSHHGRSDLLKLHRPKLLAPLTKVANRLATDPVETAITVASGLRNEHRALGVLDRAVRTGTGSPEAIVAMAELLHGRGIRQVRDLSQFIDAGAASPPESWTRLGCIRFGLPRPVTQFEVKGSNGRTYFLDLAWPEFKVGLEYDGVDFHTGHHLAGDRTRLNNVTGTTWRIFSMTNQAWWQGRDEVFQLIREAIDAAA